MSRWLVISNCQTQGLAGSLALRASSLHVDECDILAYRQDRDRWAARLSDYAKVLINPQFYESDLAADAAGIDVQLVPAIYFPGAHPDETLLYVDGAPVNSSIGVYHSLIAWASFVRKRSPVRTCALFASETYRALGYLDWWSRWRTLLLAEFADQGLDVSGAFNAWSRGRPFMYTSHHPRVDCLFDLAGVILAKAGIAPERPNALPEDRLAGDTCFPVYREFATELGFEGSYLFKPRGERRCLDLATFIDQSFAIYEGLDPERVTIEENRRPLFEALSSL